MSLLILILLVLICFIALLEISHHLRASSPLRMKTLKWTITKTLNGIKATGLIQVTNTHKRMEVMIPEFKINPILLGKENINELNVQTSVMAQHPDEKPRKDNYWQAYILKSKQRTYIKVDVEIQDKDSTDKELFVENIWIDIYWVNYGPFGRLKLRQGFVIPLKYPKALTHRNAYFKQYRKHQLLAIKTHILGPIDDINNVISGYVENIIRPGDILTIGETPLAVTQGRYLHPSTIHPTFYTKILCRVFHPTSSLATATGLQTLVDIVGPTRVIAAWVIGILGKLLGINGLFYVFAGDQARLIDDITGTTPPYDQVLVLGPKSPRKVCDQLSEELGIQIAIVDVNDLGRVKVLASSKSCPNSLVKEALVTNPAGNANQQTPLVLIRPIKQKQA